MGLIARPGKSGGGWEADRYIDMACPRCGLIVRVSPADVARRRPMDCPAGHLVVPPPCAGLDEVLAFMGALDRDDTDGGTEQPKHEGNDRWR